MLRCSSAGNGNDVGLCLVGFRPRLAPVPSYGTRSGLFSPLQVVVAPCSRAGCPAASGPCRHRHGGAWTPGSADGSHRVASSLWACGPNGVLPGPSGATSRAGNPREACGLLPHCRRIAALPLRAWGPCVRPGVACLRSGTSPWPAGNRSMASRRCACRRVAPGSRLRGCRRAGGRRRPRHAFVSHALAAWSRAGAAYGCPGSGVGAPCLWCELGPVGPTVPLRSSGLGGGRDYRRIRRRLATRAGWCGRKLRGRLGVRAPAMSGGAEHPHIAGARAMPSSRRRWSRSKAQS